MNGKLTEFDEVQTTEVCIPVFHANEFDFTSKQTIKVAPMENLVRQLMVDNEIREVVDQIAGSFDSIADRIAEDLRYIADPIWKARERGRLHGFRCAANLLREFDEVQEY